jgi:hypothetical protein
MRITFSVCLLWLAVIIGLLQMPAKKNRIIRTENKACAGHGKIFVVKAGNYVVYRLKTDFMQDWFSVNHC